ncbi:DUF308 domain-containing protein [Paenibacillus apiarius]|uniref:YqeB family protein n=1 Tax=Paenibacillus apiarius TaxID=46240 RepID=UPI0019804F3D|nr:DUF308 domain-containing protein [Paenibacillus apiarius]MBN3526673.1 DUF308 domain-containing protein [Paenibacillus apiarius]
MNEQQNRTVLGLSPLDKFLCWVVPPLVGLVIGWFIPAIAKWAVSLPWVPFKGPLELIASFHSLWVVYVTTCIGLIAGFCLTYAAFKESLVISVSDRNVLLKINGTEETFVKEDVSAAFLDGKQLVLLGTSGQELFRERHESKNELVSDAFKQHGYCRSQADPFKDEYRRWVPDSPGLTPSMNALLKARDKALHKGEKEDIKDLRAELSKLGITVRDEGKRQYWREHKRPKHTLG